MSWFDDALFYHIYPLGLCDAPRRNDFSAPPVTRIEKLYPWLDHITGLGLNSLYLGPIFESTAHGYDTADYYRIDRRLGDNDAFQYFAREVKTRGLRLVLDGVFNHVGRDFWAFRDVRQHGVSSRYVDWFSNLHFNGGRSPYGDLFTYDGWAGHYSLVKLNLHHPDVRQHLFDAVTRWVEAFDIDGLRLDAADVLDFDFMRALAAHCKHLKSDFWLMGEVIHGDYRRWANAETLHSVTNYECYKGLYSSHADRNYFEIAYALNRQFGPDGIYRDLRLYSFADNHDVNRVASNLIQPAHLYPLHILLFTMPGIPSIYYGSEWGLAGERTPHDDTMLRPALDLNAIQTPQPDLTPVIRRLAQLRRDLPALRWGDYRQLHVAHEQFAFARQVDSQCVVVAVNAFDKPATIHVGGLPDGVLRDSLNPGCTFAVRSGAADIMLDRNWGRVMVVE